MFCSCWPAGQSLFGQQVRGVRRPRHRQAGTFAAAARIPRNRTPPPHAHLCSTMTMATRGDGAKAGSLVPCHGVPPRPVPERRSRPAIGCKRDSAASNAPSWPEPPGPAVAAGCRRGPRRQPAGWQWVLRDTSLSNPSRDRRGETGPAARDGLRGTVMVDARGGARVECAVRPRRPQPPPSAARRHGGRFSGRRAAASRWRRMGLPQEHMAFEHC